MESFTASGHTLHLYSDSSHTTAVSANVGVHRRRGVVDSGTCQSMATVNTPF